MKRTRFSTLAETDLETIGDYIAQDNPRRAVSFLAELRDQCRKIAKSPHFLTTESRTRALDDAR